MSEWIDFGLYTLQIVLLWVLLPRKGAQFTAAMIVDRDADWPAKHPDVMQSLLRSRWVLNTFYVYAALSIAVLSALRLGVQVPAFSRAADAPSWEVLKDTHGTLMILGLIMYFASFAAWTRWLSVHVPLAAQRSASLKPRVAGDYLPRSWRVGTEALTAAHIALWLVVGALGWAGGAKYWWSFAFIAAMTVLFAVIAYLVPRRRPGYYDRLFGEAYRHVEIRVAYFMRLWWLPIGAVVMIERLTATDLARAGYLLIVSFVSVLALMLLRLRPVAPASGATSG
jgi:hypothetical protein